LVHLKKTLFNRASSIPNVLITDTINSYQINDSSSFSFKIPDDIVHTSVGILAINWNQKLDFDKNADGGIIEYRLLDSSSQAWVPIFSSPYVYNFYGYNSNNLDSLGNGQMAFTGQDSTWKNIWLCFSMSWIQIHQGLELRYSILTDSIDNQREGWMIDNLMVHPTFVHTLSENKPEKNIEISPNPNQGKFSIHLDNQKGHYLIDELTIVNSKGELIRHFKNIPSKFDFDLSKEPAGNYFIKVKTNQGTETLKIILLD
tara:strand:+ start:53705 stop:54478 length:774 start_codon:yes stop_codon:yes gene_type:complete